MLVIYHRADLDGITSAAIVKKYYDESLPGYKKESLVLFGIDYGEKPPNHLIKPGEKTFIVDFSFPMWILNKIGEAVGPGNLIWCDHHKTAIEEFKTLEKIPIHFVPVLPNNDAKISACELIWAYLFPLQRIPRAVELLGKYDTWRNGNGEEWQFETLPFQYAMRTFYKSPEEFPAVLLSNSSNDLYSRTNSFIAIGKSILLYQESQDAYLCKGIAYGGLFRGLPALYINAPGFSSNSWKSILDPSVHKVLVSYHYNGQQWKYSLRAVDDSVDCAELAAIYGGGGHRAAASFKTIVPADEAPFYSPIK